MKTFEISKYNPCKESLEFRSNYNTFKEAWEACPRGDWMLWIAKKVNIDLLKLTMAKALCANTVRHLMKDVRSTNAIDIAIKFGNRLATINELSAAAADAYAAYVAADAYAYAAAADAYAAYVAADAYAYAYAAAYAAYAAADAYAYAAIYAADAYADADAADADAAKKENQLQTANICRECLTEEVFKALCI